MLINWNSRNHTIKANAGLNRRRENENTQGKGSRVGFASLALSFLAVKEKRDTMGIM